MAEERVGVVSSYFTRIGVAGIELSAPLRVGDTIHVKGHTTDFTQVVDSIQIEHESVREAGAGAAIGIKVMDRCRHGDAVYRVEGT
jgi:putative protease